MEIPVIARMSDFDASITSLANPSLISRLFSIFELGQLSPFHRFWKWGALLLALIYALGSVARRIKLLFFRRHRTTSKLSFSEPLLSGSDDDVIFSDGEEEDQNDDVCSSCSSDDDREDQDMASSSCDNLGGFYEDFRVAGSVNSADLRGQKRKFRIRRRRSLTGENLFSLAEMVNGKGVVKLWDGLGLEVDLGESPSVTSGDSISMLYLDKNVTIGSIMGRIPAASSSPSSPSVVLTASAGGDGGVGVSSWDMRLRQRRPAVEAEWRLGRPTGPVVEVKTGGVDKVFLRDDVSMNVTVGDMRKAKFPLEAVTELDGRRWFDPNAVSETEEE